MVEKMFQVKFPIIVRKIDGSIESYTLKAFCSTFLDQSFIYNRRFDDRFGKGFRRSAYDAKCFDDFINQDIAEADIWNDFVAYDLDGEAIDPEYLFSVARSALYLEKLSFYGRRVDDPANPRKMPGAKRSGPWITRPRIHGSIKQAAAWMPEEEEARPRLSVRMIRESKRRGTDRSPQRSWKSHRKTQWKTRSDDLP